MTEMQKREAALKQQREAELLAKERELQEKERQLKALIPQSRPISFAFSFLLSGQCLSFSFLS